MCDTVRRNREEYRSDLFPHFFCCAEQPRRCTCLLPGHSGDSCSLQSIGDNPQVSLIAEQRKAITIERQRIGKVSFIPGNVSEVSQRADDPECISILATDQQRMLMPLPRNS